MEFQEFLKSTIDVIEYGNGYSFQKIRPRIVCNDGFSMSVQGSNTHYCSPREDCLAYYDDLEIGFPSVKEDSIMEYAEESDNPCGTVYGYVPINVIESVIEKHGGIDVEKTFKKENEND